MKIEEITLTEYKVQLINSIAIKYPKLRQASKTVTFAAQYGGTWKTFMNNSGFSENEAKQLEINYRKLYKHSIDFIDKKIEKAHKEGFVTGAFGLRLRTPILKQVLFNSKNTPYEALAEARTAGNAIQQSFGLLNNRAAIEFQNRILNSKYKYDILPIAHIHDAQYFIIKNHLGCIKWFNDNLIECMEWQELPEIMHEKVHLGGSVELFFPDWSNGITLPNNASKVDILAICSGK